MFGLSTELTRLFGHRKEIRVLTFRALTPRQIRSNEGLTLETSALEFLYGVQIILSTPLIKPNITLTNTQPVRLGHQMP